MMRIWMNLLLVLEKFDIRKHLAQEGSSIKVLLLIRFVESHFYVWNVWVKYILMNGIFSSVLIGEQKLGLGSLSIQRGKCLFPKV